MRRVRGAFLLMLAAAGLAPAAESPIDDVASRHPPGTIRIATFNASLNRTTDGGLRRDLATVWAKRAS